MSKGVIIAICIIVGALLVYAAYYFFLSTPATSSVPTTTNTYEQKPKIYVVGTVSQDILKRAQIAQA